MFAFTPITINACSPYEHLSQRIELLNLQLEGSKSKNIYEVESFLHQIDDDDISRIKHIVKIDGRNSVTSDLCGLLLAIDLVNIPEDDEDDEDDVIVPDAEYKGYFDLSDVDEILLNR